jgi:transcription elongation factor GreA
MSEAYKMDKVPVTPAGHKVLVAELAKRKNVIRQEIVESIATAREHGDLKENAEYHAAKEQQAFNEGRIQELEGAIGAADVIDPSKFTGNTVKFGAKVVIVDEDTDEERSLQIVGEYESNADKGEISITSPIARALIGKSIEDSVKVVTPRGEVSYEILKVTYS